MKRSDDGRIQRWRGHSRLDNYERFSNILIRMKRHRRGSQLDLDVYMAKIAGFVWFATHISEDISALCMLLNLFTVIDAFLPLAGHIHSKDLSEKELMYTSNKT